MKFREIRESRKIELQYRKSLLVRVNWLKEHQNQILTILKKNRPKFSVDAPATEIRTYINKLKEMYKSRFTFLMTARLAKAFFNRLNSYNTQKTNSAFEALGIDLAKTLSKEKLTDFTNIVIQNQVDLIKSIESEYFDRLEKIVYNGMQRGLDYEGIAQQITELTGATERRAKFIARDQVSTINSILSQKRALNAGITQGIWIKTKMTKSKNYTPRKSHIEADGKVFDLNKGLLVDGEYQIPGQAIGCTCILGFVVE